jgi:hypothetical protein
MVGCELPLLQPIAAAQSEAAPKAMQTDTFNGNRLSNGTPEVARRDCRERGVPVTEKPLKYPASGALNGAERERT